MKKIDGHILIVDDNEEALIALKMQLSKFFECVTVEKNPNLIPSHYRKSDFDVVILDMNFSAGINTGNEGIYWMKQILTIDAEAMVVLLTAYGDVGLAVKAMKEGGIDFIQKPWDNDKLLATVKNAWKLRRSKKVINQLQHKQNHLLTHVDDQFDFFRGTSPAMQKVLETIGKIAGTDANVLLLGENGTGKEMVAREIHRRSKRSADVFVKVDVGAISQSLFESELFGHEKGAFTDAADSRAGRFEVASGGTLFLDEIANLSVAMQSKLLSVFQNREITRLGSNKAIPIDVRLISATNMPVGEIQGSRSFREDLLYRINTIQIELPPLRKCQEDIGPLLDYFLKKYCDKYQKHELTILPSVVGKLKQYDWPGNVREFEHAVEKAVILSEGKRITQADFNLRSFITQDTDVAAGYNLEDHEKLVIAKALGEFNFNLSETAAQLGITRATLYRKIQKYEL